MTMSDLPSVGISILIIAMILLLIGFIYIATKHFLYRMMPEFFISLFMMAVDTVALTLMQAKVPFVYSELPVWAIYALIFAEICLGTCQIVHTASYLKKHITAASVKEAVDKLPAGLLIYARDGVVLLNNNVMEGLSEQLTGHTVLNGEQFWNFLREKSDNRTESAKETVIVKMPDTTVWSFHRAQNKPGLTQIDAFDCTEQYGYNERLEANNQNIKQMNDKLRAYGEHVDEVVRQEENLSTKIRIHDALGRMLLSESRYLALDAGTYPEELIREWKQTLTVLLDEGELENSAEASLRELEMAARFLNMELKINGTIPKSVHLQHLLISGARECLTNAARHAGADCLSIRIVYGPGVVEFYYTNNGTQPTGPVKEGGGLSSLRKLVERENGQLLITTTPQFIVCISVYTSQK